MKKVFIILLVLLVGTNLAACSSPQSVLEQEQLSGYQTIRAEEAKLMIDSEEVIIVDVRTEQEYEEIRIDGSILVPDYEIRAKAAEMLPNQEATILIYCRTGRRSALAAQILVDLGYANVYDFGGIYDWPYETVSGP